MAFLLRKKKGGKAPARKPLTAKQRKAVTKTVTLAPGTYRLYCTLPTHAELGMDKRITVLAG